MKLTADGPNMNFGMQFKCQQLHWHHLPLLARQDSDFDPSQTPRDGQIQFIFDPEELDLRLQSLEDAFFSDAPQ